MKYRKIPVVIEAFQWKGVETDLPDWFLKAKCYRADDAIVIETLEGDMRASFGDWVIRGVKGEIYPCKPDIFAATYEPVI